VAPLKAAADAVVVDTGDLTLDGAVERLAREVEARMASRGRGVI
jgi:cytidylate kinase